MARTKTAARRRKNGAMNGATTEPPTISDGMPPDEVFQRHLLKIRPAVGKLKKLVAGVQSQRATLGDLYERAEKDGCNRKGFKAAIALLDKAADEVAVEQRTVGRILKLIEHPLVVDHGLFPDLPFAPKPPTPYQAGLAVGRAAGHLDECPHTPGTPDFVEWHDGFTAGQRANMDSLRKASAPTAEA